MEREIKKKAPLLDGRGRLRRAGYARRMQFIYNRDRVRSFPLRLKEWDFYQIQKGNMVLHLNTSEFCNLFAFLAYKSTPNAANPSPAMSLFEITLGVVLFKIVIVSAVWFS